MSFLTAIAAFKGAFLGALVGNHLSGRKVATTKPHKGGPHHHHHRPHFTQPDLNRPQPAKPHPYPPAIDEYQAPSRPLYPLFSLNR